MRADRFTQWHRLRAQRLARAESDLRVQRDALDRLGARIERERAEYAAWRVEQAGALAGQPEGLVSVRALIETVERVRASLDRDAEWQRQCARDAQALAQARSSLERSLDRVRKARLALAKLEQIEAQYAARARR